MDNDVNSEKTLLEQVAAGDETAFRTLVKRYAGWLNTYLLQLTHQKEISEEIVQDIFLQIWLTRETLTAIRDFQNYLFIITRNHAYDALKKMRRLEKRQTSWQYDHLQQVPHPGNDDLELHLSLIDQAVAQLPPQQQKVWVLSRRERKRYQDIAAEMDLSRETVKKYLQYANAFIREYVVDHLDIWWLAFVISQVSEKSS